MTKCHDGFVGRLKKNFPKPWFRWRDGSVAKVLGDMTYEKTMLKMVPLMSVTRETR